MPSPAERFADAAVDETPDFRRHVMPLVGKLGCNGRACHGSFQGRGGFRLSLFGYDFAADHQALVDAGAEGAPRVRVDAPDESLILLKPTEQVEHEGGSRFALGGWEHHLLRRWIQGGARDADGSADLDRLEVSPTELHFSDTGATAPLVVTAYWNDGSSEDVTCLCRFETLDGAVAEVDPRGVVRSTGKGDTHVTIFYDRDVLAVPVVRPMTEFADEHYPPVAAPTRIDELVIDKLRSLGIVPSELCTDAEFLRRASIDLTGTLPTPSEVRAFLADTNEAKRTRKVDELLERPAYAAWWANKLCDYTGCNPAQQAELGQELSVQWYAWIYERLRENTPYDDLVERMLVATSRDRGQPYDEYAHEMSSYFRDDPERDEPADASAPRRDEWRDVPSGFSARATMPHYWSRRTLDTPNSRALAFAHSFLGIRLQCAECHKHPYDQWTQADFADFGRFFEGVRHGVAEESLAEYRRIAQAVNATIDEKAGTTIRDDLLALVVIEGQTVPWRELFVEAPTEDTCFAIPGFGQVTVGAGQDPRVAIMEWLRRRDNPYFARVFVNRVWATYFHRGIIEPTDDLNPANPPSNRPLLDYLSSEFAARGYDMRWLHRSIVTSHAYQRSWRPNRTNGDDQRHFSRAIPRRLPAEVVYDAVKQIVASNGEQETVRLDLSRRAVGHLSMRIAGTYAMQVFGKPERAVNCDCERVTGPALLQAVFLQNDPLVNGWLESSGWLAEVAESTLHSTGERDGLIVEAYLRALGRPPTDTERIRSIEHVTQASSPAAGLKDLLWALINTKEFVLNH